VLQSKDNDAERFLGKVKERMDRYAIANGTPYNSAAPQHAVLPLFPAPRRDCHPFAGSIHQHHVCPCALCPGPLGLVFWTCIAAGATVRMQRAHDLCLDTPVWASMVFCLAAAELALIWPVWKSVWTS